MPETPSFVEIKQWIREASEFHGAGISNNKAKSLAGNYLAVATDDPDWYFRLTYHDPVGEYVASRWAEYFNHMAVAA